RTLTKRPSFLVAYYRMGLHSIQGTHLSNLGAVGRLRWFGNQSLRFAVCGALLPGSGAFLNEQIKLVQVDRLHEMMLKSRSKTFTDITFHPETGQGDSQKGPAGIQRLHQIDTAAIG